MKTLSLLIGGLLLLAAPAAAHAADVQAASADLTEMSIEQLASVSVFSASRFEQKATEAPSSISVVTSDEIRKYGHRTLSDILKSVRGFYTSYDRNYAALGVRGFSPPGDLNTRILLMVDGHRINDGIYESATVGTEFILDVDLIERVEIVRGPSSSLYGSNAFFGVVNVITRQGAAVGGAEISGEAGSFKSYKGRATYGNRFANGLTAVVSGTLFRSGGQSFYYPEYDSPDTNNGIADRKDGDSSASFFSSLALGGFTFQAAGISREKRLPTGSYGTIFNDSANRTVDERYYADLKYEGSPGADVQLTGRLFLDWYAYRGDYAFQDNMVNPVAPFRYVNRDVTRNAWLGGELVAVRKFFESHKVAAGVEIRDYFRQDQKNFNDTAPDSLLLDERHRTSVWALYLQDDIEIAKGLILNIGVRHDDYSTFGGTTHPRGALIWNPRPETTFKLLYGTAFRAPTQYEMFYTDNGATQSRNPDLKPEKITTWEAVAERSLGEHFRVGVSGYYYKITDLISQQLDPNDKLIYRNVASVQARGAELDVDGRFEGGFAGRASCTLQNNKDESGHLLTNSPRVIAKLNLTAPLWADRYFAGLETQYTGARRSLKGDTAGGYALANLTLTGRDVVKGLDASAGVYNLLDHRYGDPTGNKLSEDILQQDGRSFRAKLTYAF